MNRPTRRLVFGDDGSPAADVAWLWINNHVWPGWRLEIIAATGLPLPGDLDAGDLDPDSPVPAERPPFAAAGFTAIDRLVRAQDPRVALSMHADLLIIGTRGPGLLKRLHLGSTAEWLLVRPPAPVVVVRHGRPTRRVLLACDGSAHSGAATEAVLALPFVDRLHVSVVGVNEDDLVTDEAVEAASSRLRPACARVEAHVITGSPTQVLSTLVEQRRPDLLALGTRGRTGVTRIRLGSTAHALVHHVGCSVLVTRDPSEIVRSEPGLRS